jgi:thymidylate kinase
MRINPEATTDPSRFNKPDGLVARSELPSIDIKERRNPFQQLQDQDSFHFQGLGLDSRVLIIEGISGSGKDTFQTFLKSKLKDRDVYDYSEGELLHSWKQFPIEGILEFRIKFMKLFVNYVKDIISRDESSVFLLNRFHLSTYAWTIIQKQKIGRKYGEIVKLLRLLPVHVFIMQVEENEIEKRSLHPERSSAWRKFQRQIVENYSFCERLKRQQKLIFDAARKQQIPYSVIKLPPYEAERGDAQIRNSRASEVFHCDVRVDSADTRLSQQK